MIASGNGRSSLRGRASRHSSTRSGRRPRANPVSRAALAARRRFTAEPLDPPAGRVSAGQEAPAVTGSIEDAGSQHGEDAAVLVVTDQGRGKGQALDAVTARRDQPPATSSAWARTSSGASHPGISSDEAAEQSRARSWAPDGCRPARRNAASATAGAPQCWVLPYASRADRPGCGLRGGRPGSARRPPSRRRGGGGRRPPGRSSRSTRCPRQHAVRPGR